jgi:allantoate deiminase
VAADLIARAELLAAYSEEAGRLTRRFGTLALAEAGEVVSEWMREAGLSVRRDPIGNVIGRSEGAEPDAPALMLGSHLDTVPDAGRWDGTLGVLAGIEVARRQRERAGDLPFALEVAAFADEEGSRFGTAFLGSSVVAGSFDQSALSREDADAISLEEAIRRFGGDPGALGDAKREPGSLIGYAELHIEQGPVLEASGVPLGVVSEISGQTRAVLRFTGTPGHAGTVPMELRRDALAAAAEMVVQVEAVARDTPGLVATVGDITVLPGAPNVIPGRADFPLDIRHPVDTDRIWAVGRLRERAAEIASARGLEWDWQTLHEQAAVRCDPGLTGRMFQALEDVGVQPNALVSGAGHDAATMAQVAPVAMLFVRCAGGVSHHPDESVDEADAALAVDALTRFVELVAERHSPTDQGVR